MTRFTALQKRISFFFCIFISQLPLTGKAQQNLFNVPTADITPENQFFFQQQFNIGAEVGNSNTTIDYGLGNNWEVGINLYNVDLYPTNSHHNPFFLLNFQKVIDITKSYKVGFGTQTGITPPVYHPLIEFPSYSYIINAFDSGKWGKFYLGGYYANKAYVGTRNSLGVKIGIEFPVISGKFHLMGDWITGNNAVGLAVVGVVLYLPENWQLSLGAQLPTPESQNDYGMVFGITKL